MKSTVDCGLEDQKSRGPRLREMSEVRLEARDELISTPFAYISGKYPITSANRRAGQIFQLMNGDASAFLQMKQLNSKHRFIIKAQGCISPNKRLTCAKSETNCDQQTLMKSKISSRVASRYVFLFYLTSVTLVSFTNVLTAQQARSKGEPSHIDSLGGAQNNRDYHWLKTLATRHEHSVETRAPLDRQSLSRSPAEARNSGSESGLDISEEAPKEQSRLEKLCLQTSSVLASVLPAPFGGHKRSVLCQFFAHIPFLSDSQRQLTDQRKPFDGYNVPARSVAILHQLQQPPISFPASGRHPIELVLKHHQEQLTPTRQIQPHQPPVDSRDLKSSASIQDFTYHQKLDPPTDMIKRTSARPLSSEVIEQDKIKIKTSTSLRESVTPKSSPQLISTSGWRILNHSFQTSTSQEFVSTPSTQSEGKISYKPPVSTPTIESQSKTENDSRKAREIGRQSLSDELLKKKSIIMEGSSHDIGKLNTSSPAQLLVMGRPPSAMSQANNDSTANRLIQGERTVEMKANNQRYGSATGFRTIEVTAQDHEAIESRARYQSTTPLSTTKHETSTPDIHKVQKREELVIASINNLTRIAFGNQLRDTVKIINRLIDEQTDLFMSNKPTSKTDAKLLNEAISNDKSNQEKSTGRKERLQFDAIALKQNQKATNDQRPQSKLIKKPKNSQAKAKSNLQVSTPTNQETMKKTVKTVKNRVSATKKERKSSISEGYTRKSAQISDKPKYTKSSTEVLDDIDLVYQGTTLSDIARSKTSIKPGERTISTRSITPAYTLETTMDVTKKNDRKVTSVDIPWIIPNKSDTKSISPESTNTNIMPEDKKLGSSNPVDRWTISPKPLMQMSFRETSATSTSDESKPVTVRPDSLTTLKMSLASKPSLVAPNLRVHWIPTTMIITPSPAPTTSTAISSTQRSGDPSLRATIYAHASSQPPATNGMTMTTHPHKRSSTLGSKAGIFGSFDNRNEVTTMMSTTPAMDVIEAKASESISKYTTHWNEANELLATTRRAFQPALPQIVNTGEFFSAETIASWPEKYHKVMSQAFEQSRSTPLSESTRREGESYESSILTTSRHKATTPSLAGETRRMDSVANQVDVVPGLTVLPPNHKLVATTINDERSTIRDQTSTHSFTTKWQPETTIQRQPKDTSYTLIGPYTEPDSATTPTGYQTQVERATSPGNKFPQVLGVLDYVSDSSLPRVHSNANDTSTMLKPPYSEQHPESEQSALADIQPASRHQTTRELHKLLVPSNQNFVGAQSPLNQNKFNLSALKFLAQSLLTPTKYQNGTSSENATSNRLLDLLGTPFPSSYYELLASSEPVERSNQSSATSKSILNKATNLLSDLRQLEHKKAAAILAAIRYQVPSPLVRPWDLATDLIPLKDSSSISDRLDDVQNRDLLSNLRLIDIGRAAVRAVLSRQKVVPRDELDALLISNRRSLQSTQSPSLDEYANITSDKMTFGDINVEFDDLNNQEEKNRHSPKILIDRLFRPTAQKLMPRLIRPNRIDYDHRHHQPNPGDQSDKPEYIHSADNSSFFRESNTGVVKSQRAHTLSLMNVSEKVQTSDIVVTDGTFLKTSHFNCKNRRAGFYPDEESACQTFYHCSETEHLLTFNCPQQTRFNEKLLKCGPWFDIACDIGKTNPK